jgi:DNA-binding response OmpR family regulator
VDALSLPLEPLRVTVVTVVTTAHTQQLVGVLRREVLEVALATSAVLDEPAAAQVYVVSFDPALARVLGEQFVAWSRSAGLIGVIEDGSPQDCEGLLAAGFDDVLLAPCSGRELVARIRAVHRRVNWKGSSNGRLRYGELTLDLYGRELWIDGKTIALTSIELAVVRELIKARGRPLSRAELLDLAWGEGDLEVSERAVDNVILRLRRKLPQPDLIETVRSVGFRIAATRAT